MIRLGLDFDNTLIKYDGLFYKLALEKNLIPIDLEKSKSAIRNYLRAKNLEEEFTLLQGEVYGSRVDEADQAEGMFDSLKLAKDIGIELIIVSHKTKHPYLGPKYDLHKGALTWLEKNNFLSRSGLNISRENIFFEVEKELKISRIYTSNCTHFIDDLPEILSMINNNINRILYDPFNVGENISEYIHMKHWRELIALIR